MKIGYSSIDITPKLGVELSGYGWFPGRKAESVLDNLYARAVAFEGNNDNGNNNDNKNMKLLLINCDLIAIEESISDKVRQQISEEIPISKTNIMIVCTHTHTGPATGTLIGCGEPDEDYRSVLANLLTDAGKRAFKKLRFVQAFRNIEKEIEPIGYNRVIKDGPVDNFVRGAVFYFNEGKPFAILNYGCHPVALGPLKQISADYPGSVMKALEQEGFEGVFLNGLCGDIDPVYNLIKWGSATVEIIDGYGKQIVDPLIKGPSIYDGKNRELFEELFSKGNTDTYLDAFEISLSLRLQHYKHEDIDRLLKEYEAQKEKDPGGYRVAKIWADDMKNQLERKDEPYIEHLNVQVIRVNNMILVGFPGEVFTEIGTIIRKSLPGFNILALGNVNSTMRYVPTKDDIERRGYGGLSSCLIYLRLPLQSGESERMAEIVAETIKKRLAKQSIYRP